MICKHNLERNKIYPPKKPNIKIIRINSNITLIPQPSLSLYIKIIRPIQATLEMVAFVRSLATRTQTCSWLLPLTRAYSLIITITQHNSG